jgi:hypothetical protein
LRRKPRLQSRVSEEWLRWQPDSAGDWQRVLDGSRALGHHESEFANVRSLLAALRKLANPPKVIGGDASRKPIRLKAKDWI